MPQNVIAPDTALYENCPVLMKVEAAVVQQGTSSVIQWEFRDRDGYPVDLSGCFDNHCRSEPPDYPSGQEVVSSDSENEGSDIPSSSASNVWHRKRKHPPSGLEAAILSLQGERCNNDDGDNTGGSGSCEDEETYPKPKKNAYYFEVRIQPADEPPRPMWSVPAQVTNSKRGHIRFAVPNQVSDTGGIFVINIGLCRKIDLRPVYIHRGLLAVERSAWSKTACKMPTLSDIRMRLMDTDVENLLQNYVEFTTADILDSIVSAVREWNGATPKLSRYTYTCYTFPWIEPWLWKIIANLYNKAALRYLRNKLNINHGGLQGDDLARDKEYLQVAQYYETKWKQWMTETKRELNRGMFTGSVESAAWLMRNDSYGRLVRGGWNGW